MMYFIICSDTTTVQCIMITCPTLRCSAIIKFNNIFFLYLRVYYVCSYTLHRWAYIMFNYNSYMYSVGMLVIQAHDMSRQ